MKLVKGMYAQAKIFTDDVETYAEAQVKMICDNEVADGSTICMMPDIHPGKVGPIGLSMTVTCKVIPQLLGVDISGYHGNSSQRSDFSTDWRTSNYPC